MSEQMKTALSQNDNDTIASSQNHNFASCSNSGSLTSSFENVNELAPYTIVTSISDSNNVHIDNSSTNTYHVTNHIYQQYDGNTEQGSTERSTRPKNSFSKRFCSTFRTGVQQRCSPNGYIAIPVLLLLVIVLIIALIIWLFQPATLQHPHISAISNSTSNESDFRIVLRQEWDAKRPKAAAELLKIRPPELVIIHHTYTTLCFFQEQCSISMRLIQNDHMEIKQWNDIGYHFLVGGDGLVYEGRGWNVVGAHTRGYNHWSIGIGIIGSFEKEIPTKVQLESTQKLIEYGVKNGYISSKYKLLGHRQCVDSHNPGMALYNVMKTWNHWSPICPKIRIEK